jgi:glycosyltransferase involved in cell wall biosynthesis
MKVLWFTNTPSLYDQGKHHYYGGGWIESLEEIVRTRSEIDLGVSFFHNSDSEKVKKKDVVYYPIKRQSGRKNLFKAVLKNWRGEIEHNECQKIFLNIIDDFRPDVIQIFGTEGPFALIQDLTDVPVLVHLQGLINPYLNTYFPIGYSRFDFIFNRTFFFKNLIGISPVFGYKRFKAQAEREKCILAHIKYVCGRTDWDRQVAVVFNPKIKYFHIDEVLRPVFYKEHPLTKENKSNKFVILSTISSTIYKGIDVILKTAKKLTEINSINFEWQIIGLDASSNFLQFFEQKTGVNHQTVNITLMGKMSPDKIVNQMLGADIFVHPSYIDNSPNSVCEAQMLGIPVIACHVGGLNSLITHNESGILVPSNGVFELVYYLKLINENPELKHRLAQKGKENALKRHDKLKIVDNLISVYREIK